MKPVSNGCMYVMEDTRLALLPSEIVDRIFGHIATTIQRVIRGFLGQRRAYDSVRDRRFQLYRAPHVNPKVVKRFMGRHVYDLPGVQEYLREN